MKSKNKINLKSLQDNTIKQITIFMETNGYEKIEFTNPFRIFVSEETFDGDFIKIPVAAKYLYKDGTVETDEEEIVLGTLDIYEITHILDCLEDYNFNIVEEVNLDIE